MSGYIKYFEKGGKNMSFLIKDDKVSKKFEKIWNVIKNKLSINFQSKPVYDKKYLKANIRKCDYVIKTIFFIQKFYKHKITNKRIRFIIFFPLRCFLSAFFFVRL